MVRNVIGKRLQLFIGRLQLGSAALDARLQRVIDSHDLVLVLAAFGHVALHRHPVRAETADVAIGPTSTSSHNAATALLVSAISVRTGCHCAMAWLTNAQRALSRFEEKHSAALHTVCAVPFFDGAQQVAASRNMNAPEIRAKAVCWEKKALTKKGKIYEV